MTQVRKDNFVLVRKDIPLAQQLVQAAHAAYEAGAQFQTSLPSNNYLILCEAPDEDYLWIQKARLESRGIACTIFREPDRNNEATALCTEPVSETQRRVFSRWKLWKEENHARLETVSRG